MCDTQSDSFKSSLLPGCSWDVFTASVLQTLAKQVSLLNINYFLKGLLSRSSTPPPQPAPNQEVWAVLLCMVAYINFGIHNSSGIHKGMDIKEWLWFISVYLQDGHLVMAPVKLTRCVPVTEHQFCCSDRVFRHECSLTATGHALMSKQLPNQSWQAAHRQTWRFMSCKNSPWTSVKSLQHSKGKIRPTLCHKWHVQDCRCS